MWSSEHTEYTSAPTEAVWALWSEVETWPEWDAGLEYVTLERPFAVGASGTLKPKGGPKVAFELTDVRAGEGFADETKLPLSRMRFEHSATREGDRTRITQRVTISGLGTPLFSRVIGRGIARDLPETLRALGQMAADRASSGRARAGIAPDSAA